MVILCLSDGSSNACFRVIVCANARPGVGSATNFFIAIAFATSACASANSESTVRAQNTE